MNLLVSLLDSAAKVTRRLDGELSMIKGISFNEYQILSALSTSNSGMTRVDLASAVGLTPSGVTRALKPMEKLGFVETVRDVRDARKSLAVLTLSGVELMSDATGVVERVVEDISALESLADKDREVFLRVLAGIS